MRVLQRHRPHNFTVSSEKNVYSVGGATLCRNCMATKSCGSNRPARPAGSMSRARVAQSFNQSLHHVITVIFSVLRLLDVSGSDVDDKITKVSIKSFQDPQLHTSTITRVAPYPVRCADEGRGQSHRPGLDACHLMSRSEPAGEFICAKTGSTLTTGCYHGLPETLWTTPEGDFVGFDTGKLLGTGGEEWKKVGVKQRVLQTLGPESAPLSRG